MPFELPVCPRTGPPQTLVVSLLLLMHFPLSGVTLQQLTTWPPNRHMKRVGTKYVLMRAPFAVI